MHQYVFTAIFLLSSACFNAHAQSIQLTGKTSDTTIHDVSITAPERFLWYYRTNTVSSSSVDATEKFLIAFEQQTPRILFFDFIGFRAPILITPGDQLEFEIYNVGQRLTVKFTGTNAQHYNFYPQLEASISSQHHPFYKGDLALYKKEVNAWSIEKRTFHKKYWKEQDPSDVFQKLTAADIDYEEYALLLSPFSRGKLKISQIPEGYLPTSLTFNDDQLLDVLSFGDALRHKFIFCATDAMWDNFDNIYENINTNTTGRIRSYLLTNLVGLYAREGRSSYKESLQKAFKILRQTEQDSVFRMEIDISNDAYLTLDHPFPDSVLNTTMLTEINSLQVFTLKQVLEKHKAKPIYFDFWASWCGGCRMDIEDSGKSKKLLDSLGVDVIYLSIDKNAALWTQAANTDNILKNQYLVREGIKSTLARFLTLESIPRYVLIDKSHLVKTTNAPRISYLQYDRLRDALNELNVKIVKFD